MDLTDQRVPTEIACKRDQWQLLMEDMSTFAFRDSSPMTQATCLPNFVKIGRGVEACKDVRRRRSKAGRPHSSPIRTSIEDQQRHRRYDKSPSTPRARSRAELESSISSPKNASLLGAGEKILSQRPPASAGMAYFADRPPIMPMHIMVVKQNLEPNQIIPVSIAVTTSTGLRGSNNPDVATSTDLKRSSSSSELLVRRMLRDLMSSLPLRLMSSPVSHMGCHSPGNSMDITMRSPHRVRSPAPRSVHSPASPLHIRLNYSNFDQISDTTHTVSEKGEGKKPEDWMGGVRALRDSHVRLVLRQLRHIDRLNRALDRFTKLSSKR